MDATDPLVVQVGGDDDTQNKHCPLCAARAGVEAALVRSGVERITLVVEYRRPRFGTSALERAKAFINLLGGRLAQGEGSSREEAIVNALESVGVGL